jgi:hypothetical protein
MIKVQKRLKYETQVLSCVWIVDVRRVFYFSFTHVPHTAYHQLKMVTISNAEKDDELNPATKKIHFRVAVKKAEAWKIQAIAQFKRKQEDKKASLVASNAPKSISTTNNEKRSSKKSKTDEPNDRIEPTTKFEIAQAQKQLDIWIRELELIAQNSTASKERVKQLHLARSQLLWLLKKASRHERQMVHENLSNFATQNP